jgi:hypothetical protein
MRRKRCWSFAAGAKGATVTVFERVPGSVLYGRAWDVSMCNGRGGYRRISLKHRDREAAKTYALEQAAKLRDGLADLMGAKSTVAMVLSAYLSHRSPQKGDGQRIQDARRAELWTRLLGAKRDPHIIPRALWESALNARRHGCNRCLRRARS